jgi:hypothetical protein
VPDARAAEFEAFLATLQIDWVEERNNVAYELFLR